MADDDIDFGAINLCFDQSNYKQVYAGIDFSPEDVKEALAELDVADDDAPPPVPPPLGADTGSGPGAPATAAAGDDDGMSLLRDKLAATDDNGGGGGGAAKKRPAFRMNIKIESCRSCKKPVYINDRFAVGDDVFHKVHFRCEHETCNRVLGISNYVKHNDAYYCEPHFKELFKRHGDLDVGFGQEDHKKKFELNLDHLAAAADVDVKDLDATDVDGDDGGGAASSLSLDAFTRLSESSETGWASLPVSSSSSGSPSSPSSPAPPPVPPSLGEGPAPPALPSSPPSGGKPCQECGERPRAAKVVLKTGETKLLCDDCVDRLKKKKTVFCDQCGEREAKKKVRMEGTSDAKLCLLCVAALTQKLADQKSSKSKVCEKCKIRPQEAKLELSGKNGATKQVRWCRQCVEALQQYTQAVARDRPDLQSRQTLKQAGLLSSSGGGSSSGSRKGSAVAERPQRKLSGRPGLVRKGSSASNYECQRCSDGTRAEAKVTLPDGTQCKLCKGCVQLMETGKLCNRCVTRKAAAEVKKDGRALRLCRQCVAEVQRAGTLSGPGSAGSGAAAGKQCEKCDQRKASAKVALPDGTAMRVCTQCALDLQAEAEGNKNAKLCSRCHVEPVAAKVSVNGVVHLACPNCAKFLQSH